MLQIQNEIQRIRNSIAELDSKKAILQNKLELLEEGLKNCVQPSSDEKPPTTQLTPEDKIKIFMELFRGRMDVFPKRWDNSKTGKSGYSPACQSEWVRGICRKPQIKCSDCLNQAFIPVTPQVVRKHLAGEDYGGQKRDYTIGVYPMLKDETCWFLAVDFDKEQWQRDAAAFLETCRIRGVPASLERSRSGNGGHVWIFFTEPIPAVEARRMGTALLTDTMERHPEIGFESYDRLFPNQDTMPAGGFGNLIALPLQRLPREQGNGVFLNEDFEPYPDQWQYLASIKRMKPAELYSLVSEASARGRVLGVRMPITEENEKPWEALPSRVKPDLPLDIKLPKSVNIVLGNQVFIAKQKLPPALINKIIRLAAFQNPDFYAAQAMRLSTFGKPRIIACAEDFSKHIGLPRGCADELHDLLLSLGIKTKVEDKRNIGSPITTEFLGELTTEQTKAAIELLKHDTGVLSATTGFGKTVIAANIIAARKTNTLILVHRRQLLDQWVERLSVFLDIPREHIGVIYGGKYKPTGIIDIALIQSLHKKNVVDDCVGGYGQVIVDECHHISAVSFEAVARENKAKYVLGLTATPTRKDGHQPIIFMQCGPVRYKVDAKHMANIKPFSQNVIIRRTDFQLSIPQDEKLTIQKIYAGVTIDEERNQMIFEDVLAALQAGRSPLLLTERKDHAALLTEYFSKHCANVILMIGGQNTKTRDQVRQQLDSTPESEERLIIATGRYIGEGFDDSRLDTLFLTMPISWQGTLAQYAGRIGRLHHSKKEVIIYDYVDHNVPMLSKMADKRLKGYKKLGFSLR